MELEKHTLDLESEVRELRKKKMVILNYIYKTY